MSVDDIKMKHQSNMIPGKIRCWNGPMYPYADSYILTQTVYPFLCYMQQKHYYLYDMTSFCRKINTHVQLLTTLGADYLS